MCRTGVAQDFEAFAEHELPLRQELEYPPFSRLVRIVVHADDDGDALADVDPVGMCEVAQQVRAFPQCRA